MFEQQIFRLLDCFLDDEFFVLIIIAFAGFMNSLLSLLNAAMRSWYSLLLAVADLPFLCNLGFNRMHCGGESPAFENNPRHSLRYGFLCRLGITRFARV